MFLMNILNMTEPVIAQSQTLAAHRRPHAAATVMPADDDVPHLQDIDRELHHRQTIEIRVHDQIGDIAMDE
jgi:hypothetical protein